MKRILIISLHFIWKRTMRHLNIRLSTAAVLAAIIFFQDPSAITNARDCGQPGNAPANSDLNGMLESKIRTAWKALQNNNKRAYAEFLSDDYIAVYADGAGTRDKPDVLNDTDGSAVKEVRLSSFNVAPLSPEAAFVTYEAFLQTPPNAGAHIVRVYVGEVWVKRDGQWKTLHYQETRVR